MVSKCEGDCSREIADLKVRFGGHGSVSCGNWSMGHGDGDHWCVGGYPIQRGKNAYQRYSFLVRIDIAHSKYGYGYICYQKEILKLIKSDTSYRSNRARP